MSLHLLLSGKLHTIQGPLAYFRVWTGKATGWSRLEIASIKAPDIYLVDRVCKDYGHLVETLMDGPVDVQPSAAGWIYLGDTPGSSFRLRRTGLVTGYLLEVFSPDGIKQRYQGVKYKAEEVVNTLLFETATVDR